MKLKNRYFVTWNYLTFLIVVLTSVVLGYAGIKIIDSSKFDQLFEFFVLLPMGVAVLMTHLVHKANSIIKDKCFSLKEKSAINRTISKKRRIYYLVAMTNFLTGLATLMFYLFSPIDLYMHFSLLTGTFLAASTSLILIVEEHYYGHLDQYLANRDSERKRKAKLYEELGNNNSKHAPIG